jgi:DNA-binding NarL/FixJ family response regulator
MGDYETPKKYTRKVRIVSRRLLVVEDEPLLASLVIESLRASGFEVAGAVDVESARKQIKVFDPDMVVLDISLGNGPTGVHLAHSLHLSRPDIAILFLTRHSDMASANADGLDVPPGAGFLRKHMINDTKQLIDAIEKVFAEKASEVRHDSLPSSELEALSERALAVLRMLAEGCSNFEISRRSGLSVKSVERWIETVYRELGIENSNETNARVKAAKRYFLAYKIPPEANE